LRRRKAKQFKLIDAQNHRFDGNHPEFFEFFGGIAMDQPVIKLNANVAARLNRFRHGSNKL
jgi:hypothetical protein